MNGNGVDPSETSWNKVENGKSSKMSKKQILN